MESFKMVRPGHLNQYGYLYGGILLQWVDETAWIAASRDYPLCNFVTVGLDKVEFKKSVRQGAILRFEVLKSRVGNTSVQYTANVFARNSETDADESIFSTNITFVCLNEHGQKKSLC